MTEITEEIEGSPRALVEEEELNMTVCLHQHLARMCNTARLVRR